MLLSSSFLGIGFDEKAADKSRYEKSLASFNLNRHSATRGKGKHFSLFGQSSYKSHSIFSLDFSRHHSAASPK